jgi:hypothetical protein
MGTTARGLRYPSSADDVRPYEDIQFLAEDVDDQLDLLHGDAQALSALLAVGSTTLATYANMPAGSSRSITKVNGTGTRVKILFSCSSFVTVAAATVTRFAVQVNGVDYDISQLYFNDISKHFACPTGVVYVSGLAAGPWTVQARWKRATGTGTCAVDVNDWITLDVQEVV